MHMNIATAPRERFKIALRKKWHLFYHGVKKVFNLLFGNTQEKIGHVVYYPPVKDKTVLAGLVNRVGWYLPQSPFLRVKTTIPIDKDLVNTKIEHLSPPLSQYNYIHNMHDIQLTKKSRHLWSNADMILVWNQKSMFNPRIWRHIGKTGIVDPAYYLGTENGIYQRIYRDYLDNEDQREFLKLSKENYQSLLERLSNFNKGYLFGTGPSLDRAPEFNCNDGFCIVCNSIVKNKSLLHHIKPQLIVFADAVFHFSPCRYSVTFRQMMLEAVQEFQSYIMVPAQYVPLYLAHYPELGNKIIGMPICDKKYNFPTVNNFYVQRSTNIMTLFMLPVASAVADEIFIIGADGRKPDENYFWQHSSSSQLNNLMQTVFDTHPAFFRDRIYTDYYNEHCRLLENSIKHGESRGKRYYSLTPSYIPVLANCLKNTSKGVEYM